MSMAKPPSPTNAMHCRPGWATWAAIVYGSPGAGHSFDGTAKAGPAHVQRAAAMSVRWWRPGQEMWATAS